MAVSEQRFSGACGVCGTIVELIVIELVDEGETLRIGVVAW